MSAVRRNTPSVIGALAWLLLCSSVGVLLFPSARAGEEPGRQDYDIPEGPATRSIRQIALQSGANIVVDSQAAASVRTLALEGRYTPLEALERLLASTGLAVVQDASTLSFAIRARTPGQPSITAPPITNAPPPSSTPASLKPPGLLRRLALAAGLDIAASDPVAPSASMNPVSAGLNDDVIELSPFAVDASLDSGYLATGTLSGSRLNTRLRDVPASVTVLTRDLLDDIGATDAREALLFAPNVETTANFTELALTTRGVPDDSYDNRNPQNSRIRGIGSPTNTRNFFNTFIPYDTYNTERVEVTRGPNSVLFGTGSPAGVSNVSLVKAHLTRAHNEVSLRVGSFGDWRASVDFSRPLDNGRIALRVAALKADKRVNEIEPQYDRDDRLFLTATYRPFRKSFLRVSYEVIDLNYNRPRATPPTDGITPWLAAGLPGWDPVAGGAMPASLNREEQGATSPIVIFDSPGSAPTNAYAMEDRGRRLLETRSRYRGQVGYYVASLTDESIFPFRTRNINTSSFNRVDHESLIVILEQELAEGWFVELGVSRELREHFVWDPIRTHDRVIRADANIRLLDGSPNPNYRRPYIAALPLGNMGRNERDDVRLTSSYEFDFTERSTWLGRHRLSGLLEFDDVVNRSHGLRAYAEGPSAVGAAGTRTMVSARYYIGDAITDPSSIRLYPQPFPTDLTRRHEAVPYLYFDGDTPNTVPINWRPFVPVGDQREHNGIRSVSYGATLQSVLLKDRLVATSGIRRDSRKVRDAGDPRLDSEGLEIVDDSWALPESFEPPIAGSTYTLGFVGHPAPWVSVHYNRSETFQPTPEGRNLLDQRIPSPAGTGRDFGFSLHLLADRFTLRANWFTVDQTNGRSSGVSSSLRNRVPDLEGRLFDNLTLAGRAAEWVPPPGGYRPGESPDNLTETADIASKGTEIEVVLNPTRNWRIALNAARQESVFSNVGPGIRGYLDVRLPYWKSLLDPSVTSTPLPAAANLSALLRNDILFPLDNAIAREGRPSPQQREWRANVITHYAFAKDGPLKGFSLSGSARWAGRPVIGFPLILAVNPENPSQTEPVSDLGNPYYGEPDLNFSASLNYTRKLFGNVQWKVQVQVRNLFGDDDLMPIVTNPNGERTVFRIPEPMALRVTNTLRF